MATIKKVSKAKNLSAGPSKKTPVAGPVDPKGQFTKVQKRTLGNMKKGGKMVKKAQLGIFKKKSKYPPLEGFGDSPRTDSAIAALKGGKPEKYYAGAYGEVDTSGKPIAKAKKTTVAKVSKNKMGGKVKKK